MMSSISIRQSSSTLELPGCQKIWWGQTYDVPPTHIKIRLTNLPKYGDDQFSHCLGMSYYVNFLGGLARLGSNEFHIKLMFGTHGS